MKLNIFYPWKNVDLNSSGFLHHCSPFLGPYFQMGSQHCKYLWLLDASWTALLPAANWYVISPSSLFFPSVGFDHIPIWAWPLTTPSSSVSSHRRQWNHLVKVQHNNYTRKLISSTLWRKLYLIYWIFSIVFLLLEHDLKNTKIK